MMDALVLTSNSATLKNIARIIENENITITLNRSSKASVERAAAVVDAVVNADAAVYGVNTGFGKLSSVRIATEDSTTLQRNLILSHCAGVGEATDPIIVRVMMALKVLSLGRGASGVCWKLIESIENILNAGIVPAIPSQGLVGASGNLAPLAHFAAVLMGEGHAVYQGNQQPAADALRLAGLEPITLIAKEGLALINGT